jgi:hypothetical protein
MKVVNTVMYSRIQVRESGDSSLSKEVDEEARRWLKREDASLNAKSGDSH